jgi:hypothetical protein
MEKIKKDVMAKVNQRINDAEEKLARAHTPEAIAEAKKELDRLESMRIKYIMNNSKVFSRQAKIHRLLNQP